jgi:hypothetical protein
VWKCCCGASGWIPRPSRVWLLAGFSQTNQSWRRRFRATTIGISAMTILVITLHQIRNSKAKALSVCPLHTDSLVHKMGFAPPAPGTICSHKNPFPAATRLALRQAFTSRANRRSATSPGPAPSQPHLVGDVFLLPILKPCH